MLLKEFLDNINSADDEFTMSAIVDENSNSDAPNAKYVLTRGETVIWTYDNSVRAREGLEAARAMMPSEVVPTEVVEEPVEEVEEPTEDTNNEVVSDWDNEVIEDLPSNEE